MDSTIELVIMHHENMRALYPDDELMILCECEGAVYDTRILALNVLRSFDRTHDTSFFKGLSINHLSLPLENIDDVLDRLIIPIGISIEIKHWFSQHHWDMAGIWNAHRPLANVLKVLKGLQLQDRTHVGLSTERAGRTNEEFLSIVNTLGKAVDMRCDDEMVFFDDAAEGKKSAERMIRACHHFQNNGYRLIAVIDNRTEAEPAHIFCIDRALEIMHLQSRAVREMTRMDIDPRMLAKPDFIPWDLLNTKARNEIVPSCAFSRHDTLNVLQNALA